VHKNTSIDLVWQLFHCFVFNLDLPQTRMRLLIYGLLFSGALHVRYLGPQNRMKGHQKKCSEANHTVYFIIRSKQSCPVHYYLVMLYLRKLSVVQTASNHVMSSEWWIGKGVEVSGNGLEVHEMYAKVWSLHNNISK
jgi:hypothetical protein